MGRGWESMLRSPRAGGSYGAQGHRQAGFGGVKGGKIQGSHGSKTLQHLRARACGGGNEMMSWEPRRTPAQAGPVLMGCSPPASAGWGSGQGWKRSHLPGSTSEELPCSPTSDASPQGDSRLGIT